MNPFPTKRRCTWTKNTATGGIRAGIPEYLTTSPPTQDLIIGVDNNGNKIKVTPGEILIDEEDMRPTEQYSPEFIKRNYNSKLYKAQL
jgi:hypothetical protein